MLDGIHEHSPWVAAAAVRRRPYASVAALKRALVEAVRAAPRDARLALVRAHPALAGKAALAGEVTAASTDEQSRAGLLHCSPDELAELRRLNDAYVARFGWPFIVAVRGPRGAGMTRGEIIATFRRRLDAHPDAEFDECLRQIDRIAELRLDERFAARPERGEATWDRAEALARHSDPGFAEEGQLTVTYLTDAHRACAGMIERWMRDAGFDDVAGDAVGNVVGVYRGTTPDAKRLLTGSHFDTVRNGGRFDGRLGILVPIAAVERLHRERRRLPFAIEVIAFAEEEGQRYEATFLGSRAITGSFDCALARPAGRGRRVDARRDAARRAARHRRGDRGARPRPGRLPRLRRGPHRAGAGAERARAAARRRDVDQRRPASSLRGRSASRVMRARRRWACVATRSRRSPSSRCSSSSARRRCPTSSARSASSRCPGGSTNVVPGRCRFTLDIRSTTDAVRDACARRRPRAAEGDLRATRPVVSRRRDDARGGVPERAGLAGALGSGGRVARPADPPDAERRRPRRDEAARGDAAGDAVRARRERRHQPQPARVDAPPTTSSWRSTRSTRSWTGWPEEPAPEVRPPPSGGDTASIHPAGFNASSRTSPRSEVNVGDAPPDCWPTPVMRWSPVSYVFTSPFVSTTSRCASSKYA